MQTNNRVKPNFRWIVLGCFEVVLGLCCGWVVVLTITSQSNCSYKCQLGLSLAIHFLMFKPFKRLQKQPSSSANWSKLHLLNKFLKVNKSVRNIAITLLSLDLLPMLKMTCSDTLDHAWNFLNLVNFHLKTFIDFLTFQIALTWSIFELEKCSFFKIGQ